MKVVLSHIVGLLVHADPTGHHESWIASAANIGRTLLSLRQQHTLLWLVVETAITDDCLRGKVLKLLLLLIDLLGKKLEVLID